MHAYRDACQRRLRQAGVGLVCIISSYITEHSILRGDAALAAVNQPVGCPPVFFKGIHIINTTNNIDGKCSAGKTGNMLWSQWLSQPRLEEKNGTWPDSSFRQGCRLGDVYVKWENCQGYIGSVANTISRCLPPIFNFDFNFGDHPGCRIANNCPAIVYIGAQLTFGGIAHVTESAFGGIRGPDRCASSALHFTYCAAHIPGLYDEGYKLKYKNTKLDNTRGAEPLTLRSQAKSSPFWTISPPLMTPPASRRSAARRSGAPRPGRSGRPSAQGAPRLSEFRHAKRTPFWGYRHPIGTPGLRVHTGFHDHGSRNWNADRGDDCKDFAVRFCTGQADQGDPGSES